MKRESELGWMGGEREREREKERKKEKEREGAEGFYCTRLDGWRGGCEQGGEMVGGWSTGTALCRLVSL